MGERVYASLKLASSPMSHATLRRCSAKQNWTMLSTFFQRKSYTGALGSEKRFYEGLRLCINRFSIVVAAIKYNKKRKNNNARKKVSSRVTHSLAMQNGSLKGLRRFNSQLTM